MPKQDLKYEDFLAETDPAVTTHINRINDYLLGNGCGIKMDLSKSGYVVSYTFLKTKKVIANFVFRKKGIIIRIYGAMIHNYEKLLEDFPDEMIKSIEKAPVCKRLLDPAKCNSKCGMGYDFNLKGENYKKCQYNSFMFLVNEQNIGSIMNFLENEISFRSK